MAQKKTPVQKNKNGVKRGELAICRKRGHVYAGMLGAEWSQCTHCGMWAREVRTTEEREDAPPANEISAYEKLRGKGLL